MNKDLSGNFTLLKWEDKNIYLVMPARRIFGGLDPIHRSAMGANSFQNKDSSFKFRSMPTFKLF